MQVKKMPYRIVNPVLSLVAGFFLCYFIVWIIGWSAAFTLSFEPYAQVLEYSTTLAFAISGFVTIGIPVALMFYVLAFVLRQTVGTAQPLLLAAPPLLLILLGLSSHFSREDAFELIFLSLTQYIPLIAIVAFLYRQEKRNTSL